MAEKTPLQQMIDLWEGIGQLHNDAMFIALADAPGGSGTLANDFRKQSEMREQFEMRKKTEAVIYALRAYQVALGSDQ